MRTLESPCSCERPAGLLELVDGSPVVADPRRIRCCISGVAHSPFGDENRHSEYTKKLRTMADNQVLGERDGNLTTGDEGMVTPKETSPGGTLDDQVLDADGHGNLDTLIGDEGYDSTFPMAEGNVNEEVTITGLPGYDGKPVAVDVELSYGTSLSMSEVLELPPFSPSSNVEESEMVLPPYDPDINPLSPRPTFLRYNPNKRLGFLRLNAEELPKTRLSADQFTTPKKQLARSDSCPAMLDVGTEIGTKIVFEDAPPLETVLPEMTEPLKNDEKPVSEIVEQTPESEIVEQTWDAEMEDLDAEEGEPGGFNWGRLLKVLGVLFLGFGLVSWFVLDDAGDTIGNARKRALLPWWDNADFEGGHGYHGYLDVFYFQNRSGPGVPHLGTLVREPLDNDILIFKAPEGPVLSEEDAEVIGTEVEDEAEVVEDELLGRCSGTAWDEGILGMCLDRTFRVRDARTPLAYGPGMLEPYEENANAPADLELGDVQERLEPAEPELVVEEPEPVGEEAREPEPEEEHQEPELAAVGEDREPEPAVVEEAESVLTSSDSIGKFKPSWEEVVIGVAGLLLVSLTLKLRRNSMFHTTNPEPQQPVAEIEPQGTSTTVVADPQGTTTVPPQVQPQATSVEPQGTPAAPSVEPAVTTTPVRPAEAISDEVVGSTTEELFSDESKVSGFGSFTSMEPLSLSKGQVKLTPVRRSSRLRSRTTQTN